ncbi:MAG: DUF2029 domain-containing protein [Clostridia bacterium]|nr:DUF2029 domain-containing protein [Clostridia bacterium]
MAKKKTDARQNKSKIDIMRLFIAFSMIGLVYAFLMAYLSGGDTIRDMLFWNGYESDHFMDFFNPMRDSRDLTWLYQRNIIYPPLSILMMYFFTLLAPAGSLPDLFADRYQMQQDPYVSTLFLIFAILSLLLTALCIERYLSDKKVGAERFFVAVFCLVSFPMIYCLERGNNSLLAMAAATFFVFFRNSESRTVREISYLMLAVAAGIKMFPAVFGVLLIYDKKYFAAFRTVVYGILLVVLPYLLIKVLAPAEGGLYDMMLGMEGELTHPDGTLVTLDGSLGRFAQNLLRWVDNKSYFTYNSTSVMNLFYLLYAIRILPPAFAQMGGLIAFIVTELVAFVLGFFCKREWQRVFICTYLMLNVHSVAMHYTLIYMIPSLAVFLVESRAERRKPLNIAYLGLFLMQFALLPFHFFRSMHEWYVTVGLYFDIVAASNFNKMVSCPAFQLLALIVFIDIVACSIADARRRKKIAASIKVRRARSLNPGEA